MWKFHQITGHIGEHFLKPTAKYMKIELTGKLPPCEVCAQAKNKASKCAIEKDEESTKQPRVQGIY